MTELDYKKIGMEIKMKRMQSKLSQIELAEYLGISQTHLSNAETGRTILSLKLLLKIKKRFGCTLDELVEPDGYQKQQEKKTHFKRFKLVRCDD